MNRIVVLGGSFNPPTIAHEKLMQSAMEAVDAHLGIFLPVGDEYLAWKEERKGNSTMLLPAAFRLKLLEALCEDKVNMKVCDSRVYVKDHIPDYEGMVMMKTFYPEDEIYYVTGSDKIATFYMWRRMDEFLRDFKFLIAKRGNDDLEKLKADNPYSAAHWDRFTFFDDPEDIRGISASAFRKKFQEGDESAKEMVSPKVWEILKSEYVD